VKNKQKERGRPISNGDLCARRMAKSLKINVVIPASGAGVRLGGDIPKQFLHLGGEPILKRTLAVFDSCEIVAEIAVAIPEGYADEVAAYNFPKVKHIVTGEKTRAESVFAALKCFCQKQGDCLRLRENAPHPTCALGAHCALGAPRAQIILIHDGVRPFVTHDLIERVAQAAKKYGAAIAASPVTDTIKMVGADGKISATPDRAALWQAQTPQGFTYRDILEAYAAAEPGGTLSAATDDSLLAERMGIRVKIVPSSPENIKITTPADLKIAEALL